MKAKWVVKTALATGLLLAVMPAAQARGGGFRGGGFRGGGAVFVGPAFGYGYGPMWGPWGGWGYGYPGIYGGVYSSHPDSGQIKFDTKQKDAQVYINGSYAGTVKGLKSSWLQQGDYDVEVRAANGERYASKVYVSRGGTVKIRPQFTGDRS
jgi:hypothetical protein